ncbi:PepSY domain-containing protein [Delftia tsuruhatensis]
MFQNFRLSMAWLHTWFGLALGFVLMAAFFFGALSVFDREIDRWAIRPRASSPRPCPRTTRSSSRSSSPCSPTPRRAMPCAARSTARCPSASTRPSAGAPTPPTAIPCWACSPATRWPTPRSPRP